MTISLPRYSKDSPVDLVDGAYGLAMGQIEKELSNVSTAVTKSEQVLSTAEQAKTSVQQQQGEIDKIRGDLDGLIAGGRRSKRAYRNHRKGWNRQTRWGYHFRQAGRRNIPCRPFREHRQAHHRCSQYREHRQRRQLALILTA